MPRTRSKLSSRGIKNIGTRRRGDAGVVDENIEPAETIADSVDERLSFGVETATLPWEVFGGTLPPAKFREHR